MSSTLIKMLDGLVALQAAFIAFFVDALCGYPQVLFQRIGHPVSWAGRMIALLDKRYNSPDASAIRRRLAGTLTLLFVILVGGLVGAVLQASIMSIPGGVVQSLILGICAAPFLAWKSLYMHVHAVYKALTLEGLDAARASVAQIVGRDVASLDAHGISRAAIESLAENFSDGVVAPLFWFLILGLPGLIIYKMVNTADSMIGHMTSRHAAFGRASALTDDVINGVPARLTALLIFLVIGSRKRRRQACRAAIYGGQHHRSFNAGWPEGAMAGALGVSLAGPRSYGGKTTHDITLYPQGGPASPGDILKALHLCRRVHALVFMLIGVLLCLMQW